MQRRHAPDCGVKLDGASVVRSSAPPRGGPKKPATELCVCLLSLNIESELFFHRKVTCVISHGRMCYSKESVFQRLLYHECVAVSLKAASEVATVQHAVDVPSARAKPLGDRSNGAVLQGVY